MTTKYVYFFGDKQADGEASNEESARRQGSQPRRDDAASACPCPPASPLATDVCTYFYEHDRQVSARTARAGRRGAAARSRRIMGAKFGDSTNPLLLSCRSGARDSMPGMMDTVLNIGLNDTTVKALIEESGNERFALGFLPPTSADVRRRGAGSQGPSRKNRSSTSLSTAKNAEGVKLDNEAEPQPSCDRIDRPSPRKRSSSTPARTSPKIRMEQIWGAIGAVFGSWMNDRACVYRRQYGIPDEWGTACNVMAMVFGNLGDDCATGVALTRDGALGTPGHQRRLSDQRPGRRRRERLAADQAHRRNAGEDMPQAFGELVEIGKKLEKHYRNMQDIEFTISREQALHAADAECASGPGSRPCAWRPISWPRV